MVPSRAPLCLALLLAACGDDSATGAADLESAGPDLALADLAPAPYYPPDGYSVVPFVSDTATTHTFAQADSVLEPGKDYLAVIETTRKDGVGLDRMVVDLFETQTPLTVNSFVFLALHHYFDGIAFHRVVADFIAQSGDPDTLGSDPSRWGGGGPGYGYGLEVVKTLSFDGPGAVGMARASDPDSNGSQFFVTLSAQPGFDGQFTLFGRVTDGLAVLPTITRGEPPALPTRIARAYIVAR